MLDVARSVDELLYQGVELKLRRIREVETCERLRNHDGATVGASRGDQTSSTRRSMGLRRQDAE